MNLIVNEIFPATQGEGPTAGERCVFLRLAGCNLHCIWCDTPYAWNYGQIGTKRHGLPVFDAKKETHAMTPREVMDEILKKDPEVKRVVITGGEPMLQQKALIEFIKMFNVTSQFFSSFAWEIETNGTVMPDPELVGLVEHFNVSPKLENSGNSKESRFKFDVLRAFENTGKAFFKFVVMTEEDIDEVVEIVEDVEMTRVLLMAQGASREDQIRRMNSVFEIAKAKGWGFSPRLHVLAFDTKRGV